MSDSIKKTYFPLHILDNTCIFLHKRFGIATVNVINEILVQLKGSYQGILECRKVQVSQQVQQNLLDQVIQEIPHHLANKEQNKINHRTEAFLVCIFQSLTEFTDATDEI